MENDTPKKEGKKVIIELAIPIFPCVLVTQKAGKPAKAGYSRAYAQGYGSIKWGAEPSRN